ncbi:LOW QUALITY PROTEIN: transmembrane protein 88B [Dromiciops gliroides]|uniref:LOW QUALITY PROTEIN: transmembrane protein 88B n=1 Tax=Dromiciops gliroides TaxID=33562 RepID=UPI001CC535BD|nr:LOW QUALITY PROTEIN: transmembrane protein 88B [Dromiciops gliroides]
MAEPELEAEAEDGVSDTSPMLPGPRSLRLKVPHLHPEPLGPAGRCLWALMLATANLTLLFLHLLLPTAVFSLALLPSAAVVYLGFHCHSRVLRSESPPCRALLDDRSSSALIVLGFLTLPPLLVLASAAYGRLIRRLCPLLPPPPWATACARGSSTKPQGSCLESQGSCLKTQGREGDSQARDWV